MPDLFSYMTHDEFMELLKKEDFTCPCCKRHARISPLRIHSTLARMLIALYRQSYALHEIPDGLVHIEQFRPSKHSSGRDFCIVKHWGLAEPMDAAENEDKNSSGQWRLTTLGVRFVQNLISIPRNAFVFDNKVVRFSPENVTIEKCLGDKFRYSELMEKTDAGQSAAA